MHESRGEKKAFREGCADLSTKILGLDVAQDDEAGRCSRDLEWAADVLFGNESYLVKRDSDGDQRWVRAASTLLLGCMLHPGSSALQQGVDNFRQRRAEAEKFGRERERGRQGSTK